MKKIKLTISALSLNREEISTLNGDEMKAILGGDTGPCTTGPCPTNTCGSQFPCYTGTGNLTNDSCTCPTPPADPTGNTIEITKQSLSG